MRSRWAGAITLGLLGLLAPAVQAQLCPVQIGEAVEALAAAPELRSARLGVLVATESGRSLYARDADRFFVPASNVKLFTTAAALHRLGPDYRIRTSIHGDLSTDPTELTVVGRGDPSFATEQLTQLAAQLQAQGITDIDTLTGLDTHFPGSPSNLNWEWEDVQAGYGAPVNSLILNRNRLGLTLTPQAPGQPLAVAWDDPVAARLWLVFNSSRTVSDGQEYLDVGRDLGQPVLYVRGQLQANSAPDTASIAVVEPALVFLRRFQEQLQAQGIVAGVLRPTLSAPLELPPELAAVVSPALAELLVPANRSSDNLYAEALLKTLGVVITPDTADATTAGLAAVEAALAEIGVDPDGFELVDGSGIARQNLATPQAIVSLLQRMATHPHGNIYRQSLAVAGVNGTLGRRLRDTPSAGRLQGKSGAMTGNVSLSGYLQPAAYEPLVFSIVINHSTVTASRLRQLIDALVLQLGQLQPCS